MVNKGRIGYRIDLRPPKDKWARWERNRFLRWINFIVSSVALLCAPTILVAYWGGLFEYEPIGRLLGFCVGGALEAWIAPSRMFVYNPEWTAYVTQNAFTGKMVPYGPGLHLSYWWEERNKRGNYSLRVITRGFSASVATQTAKVVIKGEYEYAIDLKFITRAIGVDETTIESGITAFIESFLTGQCAAEKADAVRGMIDELNRRLADEFMCEVSTDENVACERENLQDSSSFGSKYGFITVGVVISSISFSDATQKTRDAIDEAVALHSVVANMYGFKIDKEKGIDELAEKLASKEISVKEYNTMLNRALAASDNAKMDLNVLEADIPALVGKVVEKFAKGGQS